MLTWIVVVGVGVVVALALLAFYHSRQKIYVCPPIDEPHYDIRPCVCNPEKKEIRCTGHEPLDLRRVFHILNNFTTPSEKSFSRFMMNNTAVSDLPPSVFGDFTFGEISLMAMPNLHHIHRHAFHGTHRVTTSLMMDSLNLTETTPTELFSALRGFIAAERMTLRNNNIRQIPENAFNPETDVDEANDEGLQVMNLSIFNDTIESIGKWAFKRLPNVVSIILANNELKYIHNSSFAFEWHKANTVDILRIDLSNNKLRGDSFDTGAFDELNRRVMLDLSDNRIEYLDQNVWESVLNEWPENTIEVDGNPFKCRDCRNKWLVRDKQKYENRIIGLICKRTGAPLWDDSVYSLESYAEFGCPD